MTSKPYSLRIYLKPLPLTACYIALGLVGLSFFYMSTLIQASNDAIGIFARDMSYVAIALSIYLFGFSAWIYKSGLEDEKFWSGVGVS